MAEEINYNNFVSFIEASLKNKESEVFTKTAVNFLVKYDSMAYYGHIKYNLSLEDLHEIMPIGREKLFIMMRFLASNGLIKRFVSNDKNHPITLFSISNRFFNLKNEYITKNETNWRDYGIWINYFNIYQDNTNFIKGIKYSIYEKAQDDHVLKTQLIELLNSYIPKITQENDPNTRLEIKEEIKFLIDSFIKKYN